jgi:hypothetical protein
MALTENGWRVLGAVASLRCKRPVVYAELFCIVSDQLSFLFVLAEPAFRGARRLVNLSVRMMISASEMSVELKALPYNCAISACSG